MFGHENRIISNTQDGGILILLDLTMPYKSGIEILSEIRAKEDNHVVIMTSGLPQDEILESLKNSNLSVEGLINKPYTIEKFRQILVEVIEKNHDLLDSY